MVCTPYSFFTVYVGESNRVEQHRALGAEGVEAVNNVNRIHLYAVGTNVGIEDM